MTSLRTARDELRVQLGPRPFYLLDRLAHGPLRERLDQCREGPFRRTRFSIGHRGAPMQFPEHTRESYLAASRMGAGAIECDVTFTKDLELVCRHSQCDLHSTTNILETELASRCSEGFSPAEIDPETGALIRPARARCCASDLTLDEFRTLEGRMDASDPRAQSVDAFLDATPSWRTDLYANGGTLMTHAESLLLFKDLGVAMTPELKLPMVEMPFHREEDLDAAGKSETNGRPPADDRSGSDGIEAADGIADSGSAPSPFGRRDYAAKLLSAYIEAGIAPEDVMLQSFDREDIRLWRQIAPAYGARAVWLDERDPLSEAPPAREFEALHAEGIRTIAPAISMLLTIDESGTLRASTYARRARAAGLEIVAWTTERSGRIREGRVESRETDFYYGPLLPILERDGDLYRILDALVQQVGIRAVFSDWPATTTYYANCMGLE